mgnify:CR=1 FL=1
MLTMHHGCDKYHISNKRPEVSKAEDRCNDHTIDSSAKEETNWRVSPRSKSIVQQIWFIRQAQLTRCALHRQSSCCVYNLLVFRICGVLVTFDDHYHSAQIRNMSENSFGRAPIPSEYVSHHLPPKVVRKSWIDEG